MTFKPGDRVRVDKRYVLRDGVVGTVRQVGVCMGANVAFLLCDDGSRRMFPLAWLLEKADSTEVEEGT
jgi:hypothetical protein